MDLDGHQQGHLHAHVLGGAYKWLYDVEHVGFKHHGNSIMAAMALVGLRYLEEDNAFRRKLAAVRLGARRRKGSRNVPVAPAARRRGICTRFSWTGATR